MTVSPLAFVVVALAVYRIAYMMVTEDGPFNIFRVWRNFLSDRDEKAESWITRGFHCVMCLSFWIGFVGAIGLLYFDNVFVALCAYALALSAVTVVLKKYLPERY